MDEALDGMCVVIDGEWRESTDAERRSLGVVAFECTRHAAYLECESSWGDCVPRMVRVHVGTAGTWDGRSFRIKDKRRTR